ncbi:MAG: sigma-70 family RNA polymerase sigma factor [Anaeromyxobacter sp.]
MPSDPAWDAALRAAREAAPDVKVDPAALAARAGQAWSAGARAEHLPDLLVAWAAGQGDPAALRRLEALLAPEVDAAARGIDRSPAFRDEVGQAVRVRLLAPERGHPRILDYGARGPLGAWLRVAAVRAALNLRRAEPPVSADVLAELVSAEADPELRHMKSLYRSEFRAALAEALSSLPERQRAILRLCHVDGLRLAQLARLYQVHESTASRWLAAAAAAVADGARSRLVARLSVSPESVDSLARMVMSNLDLSIARILEG